MASFIKAQDLSCFVYDNEFEGEVEGNRKNGLLDYSIKCFKKKPTRQISNSAVNNYK